MVRAIVFVEGGPAANMPKNRDFELRFQQAFKQVLGAVAPGLELHVEPGGSRDTAYRRYAEMAADDATNVMLLVDAETPVALQDTVWQHLAQFATPHVAWTCPPGTTDAQAHLMVQVMESWFVVDQGKLASYFGDGFDRARFSKTNRMLAKQRSVESVSKATVLSELKAATRNSAKGKYDDSSKNTHSPALLGQVDLAGDVAPVSAWAQRLVAHLRLLAAQ